MIEVIKEEMNKSLKEIQEKTKKIEEINKYIREAQEKANRWRKWLKL